MKVNELMIGDIVRVAKDVCIPKGTIVSIKGIDADDSFIEKNLVGSATCLPINDEDGMTNGVWVEYLEPIPLTPEILEKNGFIHYDMTDFWMWKEESSEPIHLDNYHKNGWRLRINCDSIPCECKFVHQLQHALRLCGIKKTIEL